MLRREARILSYAHALKPPMGNDRHDENQHDEAGHHRYYGSSETNNSERLVETRSHRPATLLSILGL